MMAISSGYDFAVEAEIDTGGELLQVNVINGDTLGRVPLRR